MTDMKQSFMADILANPDDDTPRLIFADWLQDHGEEMRAEFIREQIAAAKTGHASCMREDPGLPGHCNGICVFCKHMMRAKKCLEKAGSDVILGWTHPFDYHYCADYLATPLLRSKTHPTLYLWRGFVSAVSMSAADWHMRGPSLVSVHPIGRVILPDTQPRRMRLGNNGTAWTWATTNYHLPGHPTGEISPEVFSFLPEGGKRRPHPAGLALYRDQASALDALSEALIGWAKSVRTG